MTRIIESLLHHGIFIKKKETSKNIKLLVRRKENNGKGEILETERPK